MKGGFSRKAAPLALATSLFAFHSLCAFHLSCVDGANSVVSHSIIGRHEDGALVAGQVRSNLREERGPGAPKQLHYLDSRQNGRERRADISRSQRARRRPLRSFTHAGLVFRPGSLSKPHGGTVTVTRLLLAATLIATAALILWRFGDVLRRCVLQDAIPKEAGATSRSLSQSPGKDLNACELGPERSGRNGSQQSRRSRWEPVLATLIPILVVVGGIVVYYVLSYAVPSNGTQSSAELPRRLLSFCILGALSLHFLYLFWRALDTRGQGDNPTSWVTSPAFLGFQLLGNILFLIMYLISFLVPTYDGGLLVVVAVGSIFVLTAIYWRALRDPPSDSLTEQDDNTRRTSDGGTDNPAYDEHGTYL